MKIEILGPGCFRCQLTEQNVKKALKALDMKAEVTHVTDFEEFAKRGVMFTPAVVVDGQVKTSGKIPTTDEIKKILSSGK